tara:strand:+ start:1260 stop:2114 length:855 start_codon:yes stop_codon:yes gene_type:complete
MASPLGDIELTDPNVGNFTGVESNLSPYVGPYVTEMLGRGQGLASMPYEAYTGPLTAGPSDLQTQAFQGLSSINVPTSDMGAFTPQSFTGGIATQYMNPFLEAALAPQIAEARRQSDISALADATRLTKAGAFGGSRQAILDAERDRNLQQNLAAITGKGYTDAFDRAMGQFNVEQDRGRGVQEDINKFGLAALARQANLGAVQRDIDAEGITADRLQFEEERDFPYKQVQYMQSLLQGLPLATKSYTYQQPSPLSTFASGAGNLASLTDAFTDYYKKTFGGDK